MVQALPRWQKNRYTRLVQYKLPLDSKIQVHQVGTVEVSLGIQYYYTIGWYCTRPTLRVQHYNTKPSWYGISSTIQNCYTRFVWY